MSDLSLATWEIRENLNLNQKHIAFVLCNCGEYHETVGPMTPDERRAANRNRVHWSSNSAAYLAAEKSNDAWQFRTLNLDGMMTAGRI